MINDYTDITLGMYLYSASEDYVGKVVYSNNTLYSDVMGWGYEPVATLDLDDLTIMDQDDIIKYEARTNARILNDS